MPSYTIYANSDDYDIASEDDGVYDWAGVRECTLSRYESSNTANQLRLGARLLAGSLFSACQAFLHFDTSAVTGTETSTTLTVKPKTIYGSGDTIEAREKTWSGSGTGNMTAGSSLGSLATFTATGVNFNSTAAKVFTKDTAAITKSATYGLVLYATRQRTNVEPTGEHWAEMHSTNATGTTNDPYLSITTSTGFTLACDAGAFTYTGQAVGLNVGRLLAADGGTYSLTGQTVSLLHGRTLAIDAGSYTFSGQDLGLLAGRLLALDGAAYTLTGQDATLLAGRTISVEPGAYTLTGTDMDFVYWPHVQPGSVSWSDIAPTAGAWTPITPTTVTWS